MPIDEAKVTEYMTELFEATGLPADQKPAFLANDKVKASARKRYEDIERETGRTAAEKARADKATQEKNDEYQRNLKIYNDNKAVLDGVNAKIQAYETAYGPLSDDTKQQIRTDALDKKTLDEELRKRDGYTIGLVKAMGQITNRHSIDFPGQVVDFEAIEKIAIEKGKTALDAYDEWIGPKRTEKSNADWEAKIKAAREEGFRDGESKKAAAVISDAAPKSDFMRNLRKQNEGAAKTTPSAAFQEGWNNYQPKQ